MISCVDIVSVFVSFLENHYHRLLVITFTLYRNDLWLTHLVCVWI